MILDKGMLFYFCDSGLRNGSVLFNHPLALELEEQNCNL